VKFQDAVTAKTFWVPAMKRPDKLDNPMLLSLGAVVGRATGGWVLEVLCRMRASSFQSTTGPRR